jgi:hypothetical protein
MDSAAMTSALAALSVGVVDASSELVALRDSEARYRFPAESTSGVVVRATMDEVLLYVSPPSARFARRFCLPSSRKA